MFDWLPAASCDPQMTQGDLQIAQLACRSFGALDTSYLVVILHLALMAMAASIMLPKARVNGKEGGKVATVAIRD